MSRICGLLVALALSACGRDPPPAPVPSAAPPSSAQPEPRASSAPAAGKLPASSVSPDRFAALFEQLSETDRYYFSDNFVSNETSYLHVAGLLARQARKHGAYLGVGPEQNFSYIALVQPKLAFIVDIRRQNALLHLLYKALFEQASSRAHFLALLLGRAWQPAAEPGAGASIATLLEAVERLPRERAAFARTHAAVRDRLQHGLGLRLTRSDLDALERTHAAFAKKGLDLRFELRGASPRRYPALRELLSAGDENGHPSGFLADERAFRSVQELQRQNRVIPVVGDFAGAHALRAVARELSARDLPVSVFYVSNVEQYLNTRDKWRAWTDNVAALPTNEQSLFVRAYLDQGRPHPLQRPGHRTATVVGSFDSFRWREHKGGYRSYWQIVNDEVLEPR